MVFIVNYLTAFIYWRFPGYINTCLFCTFRYWCRFGFRFPGWFRINIWFTATIYCGFSTSNAATMIYNFLLYFLRVKCMSSFLLPTFIYPIDISRQGLDPLVTTNKISKNRTSPPMTYRSYIICPLVLIFFLWFLI